LRADVDIADARNSMPLFEYCAEILVVLAFGSSPRRLARRSIVHWSDRSGNGKVGGFGRNGKTSLSGRSRLARTVLLPGRVGNLRAGVIRSMSGTHSPVRAGVQVVRGVGDLDPDGHGLEKVDRNSAACSKVIGGARGRAPSWAPDRFDAKEIESIRKPGNEG
jgi:hypothetical protein